LWPLVSEHGRILRRVHNVRQFGLPVAVGVAELLVGQILGRIQAG
jgi:hypothetical protein